MAIVRADALRTLGFGGISASYAPVGGPLQHNWRMVRIINATNGDLIISFDGIVDNLFIPATSYVLYDISTNAPPISETDNLVFGINTQFYVKQSTAPSSGAIWIEGLYAKGE